MIPAGVNIKRWFSQEKNAWLVELSYRCEVVRGMEMKDILKSDSPAPWQHLEPLAVADLKEQIKKELGL